jgi:hypothetical protein
MRQGAQTVVPMDSVVFGARTAEALAAEADLREHEIITPEGFEPLLLKVASDGRLNWPNFRSASVRQIAVLTTLEILRMAA